MATGRIGVTPNLRTRWSKAPAGGTTSLSGLDDNSVSLVYDAGFEAVYRNGVLLSRGNDYTATNGTTITLVDATIAGDIIEVFANQAIPLTSTYTQAVADGKFINNTLVDAKGDIVTATAADTPARLAVGSNDQVLTADSSTATGLKWAAVASGYSTYQLFTSSTTWTVPAGITKVAVYGVGGGGGGGSGSIETTSSGAQAGSGGGGGQMGFEPFYSVTPGASITVTIGAGGNGAAGVASATGPNGGIDGSEGNDCVFGGLTFYRGVKGVNSSTSPTRTLSTTMIAARVGGAGGNGNNSAAAVAGGDGIPTILTQAGSLGSNGTNATAGTNQGAGGTSITAGFGGGGGMGGNCDATGNVRTGGAGVSGGGSGGGGARSSTNITTTAGNGGNGAANRGGGGGGGGSAGKVGTTSTTVSSGSGGNGGSGFIAIFYQEIKWHILQKQILTIKY